jgi:hypothetical protein
MMTKQNDAVALTDEQLDGVSGGPHYSDWNGSRHNVVQVVGVQGGVLRLDKSSPKSRFRGCVPAGPDHFLPWHRG